MRRTKSNNYRGSEQARRDYFQKQPGTLTLQRLLGSLGEIMRRNLIARLSEMLHRYFQFLKLVCQESEFAHSEKVAQKIREDDL